MNFRVLSKLLGFFALVLGVIFAGLCFFSFVQESSKSAVSAFTYSSLISLSIGAFLFFIGWGKIKRISRREGVAIVGLAWFLSGVLGAIPFMLCSPNLPWYGALFESFSGFTTTGATVIEDLNLYPSSLLLWRSLSQWLGGLGILVLFVALLSQLGVGNRSVFQHESSMQTGDANVARAKDMARMFLKVYFWLSFVCVVGLKVLGMTWFDAVNHGITTVSTGGFSPHNESIAYFKNFQFFSFLQAWIILFMFLCSLNFALYVIIAKRGWSRLRLEEESISFLFWLLFVTAIIFLSHNMNWDLFPNVLFTVVSLASTTGFSVSDYGAWSLPALILLGLCMLFGACSGSTSGGMKWNRFFIFLKIAFNEMVKIFRPGQVKLVRMNGGVIREKASQQIVFFLLFYLLILFFSIFVVSILENSRDIHFGTVLGIVFSAISNIGPGFGQVGPMNHFAGLTPASQIFCCFLMVLGRLEIYAGILLFLPSFWKKY